MKATVLEAKAGSSAGVPRPARWTDHALMSLPANGCKYELWDGELIMSPGGFIHGDVCSNVIIHMGTHVRSEHLGRVCDGQTGFRLTHGFKRKTVLSPDVSFISRQRAAQIAEPEKFVEGGPDLAVEVLSPGDSLAKTKAKIRSFFRNGTRLGWIVDPKAKSVLILTPDGGETELASADGLDGGDVVPGLKIRVGKLFD